MLVDSHCHLNMLDLTPYDGDLAALIDQAKQVGVEHILCVGVDLVHAQEVIDIAQRFAHVSASVGVHPSEKLTKEPTAEELVALAGQDKVVAIGETGLDYHYNKTGLENMRQRFRCHIQVARQLRKPLIIHSRDAREDTIAILRQEKADEVSGVMHCFTENWDMAKKALDLDFYISFSGIITFKNAAEVADVASKVPLEKMLIETDAPYLAPVPYRGKSNEPQYVRFVAERVAELKGIAVEEVARQTSDNYLSLFNA